MRPPRALARPRPLPLPPPRPPARPPRPPRPLAPPFPLAPTTFTVTEELSPRFRACACCRFDCCVALRPAARFAVPLTAGLLALAPARRAPPLSTTLIAFFFFCDPLAALNRNGLSRRHATGVIAADRRRGRSWELCSGSRGGLLLGALARAALALGLHDDLGPARQRAQRWGSQARRRAGWAGRRTSSPSSSSRPGPAPCWPWPAARPSATASSSPPPWPCACRPWRRPSPALGQGSVGGHILGAWGAAQQQRRGSRAPRRASPASCPSPASSSSWPAASSASSSSWASAPRPSAPCSHRLHARGG
eukprot:COSAG04_NODE_1712_length_5832_cov_8.246991_5_plen_307_part_00